MIKALDKENKKKTALPSVYLQHSAKKIQKKENKLCRVPDAGTRQSIFLKNNKKHISLPSADAWHSAKGPSP